MGAAVAERLERATRNRFTNGFGLHVFDSSPLPQNLDEDRNFGEKSQIENWQDFIGQAEVIYSTQLV